MERSRKLGYESCYNVNSSNFMKKRRSSVHLNNKKLPKTRKKSLDVPFKTLCPLNADYVHEKKKILMFYPNKN